MPKTERVTVDLSAYPDLVVIYLGMRVRTLFGWKTLFGFGPNIEKSAAGKPDGLLLHETIVYGLFPAHVGMRQYWRDFASLERFAASEPHRTWWRNFLRDSGGTGFWHEAYSIRGGFESIYDDMGSVPVGMMKFAPIRPARGSAFRAHSRLAREAGIDTTMSEQELYGDGA